MSGKPCSRRSPGKGGMMKYLRWATLAVALVFSTIACVPAAEAASKKGAPSSVQQTAKKTKKPLQVSSTKKSVKKSSKKSGNKSTKAALQSDREIWMKRARSSSELLGKASWYGSDFHGGRTASGEEYDMYTYTAAHRTLPLGTVVEVTEENTGRTVMVCINNRGPFKRDRVIDLSYAAAGDLGIRSRGVAAVNLRVVSNAEGEPLNSDEAFYVQLERENQANADKVGPFVHYADASVMKEVLRYQYPQAAIVLGPAVASK